MHLLLGLQKKEKEKLTRLVSYQEPLDLEAARELGLHLILQPQLSTCSSTLNTASVGVTSQRPLKPPPRPPASFPSIKHAMDTFLRDVVVMVQGATGAF